MLVSLLGYEPQAASSFVAGGEISGVVDTKVDVAVILDGCETLVEGVGFI